MQHNQLPATLIARPDELVHPATGAADGMQLLLRPPLREMTGRHANCFMEIAWGGWPR